MNGRRIYHARGKVLGGSSSINGMIFQRGNPLDYQRWAADPGMHNWDYAHCLPYFNRMENCLAADPGDVRRGHDGPLELERGPAAGPLFTAFFEAVRQAGYAITDDVNGYRQEGFAPFDRTIRRGRRLSAARAYLRPARRRPTLAIRTRALATRILFDGTRTTGVEYRWRGVTRTAWAGEVSPGPTVQTDQEILDWVASDAETALHPSCTARMGIDAMSVTDPDSMRVHGLDALRAVDAAVLPYVTNGNIYAPVMMVAEKAADLIAGNTPLPPIEADFYQHRAAGR